MTREQIEEARDAILDSINATEQEFACNKAQHDLLGVRRRKFLNALCDMALRAAEPGQPVAWAIEYMGEIVQCYVSEQKAREEYEYRQERYKDDADRRKLVPLYTHTRPDDGLVEITDEMALAFHRAITDGAIGAGEIAEIKIGLRAALLGGENE